MTLGRRLRLSFFIALFAAMEIVVSIPQAHDHPSVAGPTLETAFCSASLPDHSHGRPHEPSVPHHCLACRAFAAVATLTPAVDVDSPGREAEAAFVVPAFAIATKASPADRGRAPPTA